MIKTYRSYERLSDGRMKKITLQSGATREFFYQDTDSSHAYVAGKNKHLRRTLDKKSGGQTITDFQYELDRAGVRLAMTDKDGGYYPNHHDPGYRLTTEGAWSAKTAGSREFQFGYAYDENSNRIREFVNGGLVRYEVGDNNELLSAGVYEFEYDHFGNTVKQTNTDTAEEFDFVYDFESHLIQGKVNNTLKDEFVYNADGQRTGYRFNAQTDMFYFAHCEVTGNLLCEYWFIGGVYNAFHINTWGDYGLISLRRGGATSYFHFDGLGSTWALTDSSQNVTDTYSYSAFGVQMSSTGSSVNPSRFLGQWGVYDGRTSGSPFSMLYRRTAFWLPAFGNWMNGIGVGLKGGSQQSPVHDPDDLREHPTRIGDPCSNACWLEYLDDLGDCAKRYRQCIRYGRWLIIPWWAYCQARATVCQKRAYADLLRCEQCCQAATEDTWREECFGKRGQPLPEGAIDNPPITERLREPL